RRYLTACQAENLRLDNSVSSFEGCDGARRRNEVRIDMHIAFAERTSALRPNGRHDRQATRQTKHGKCLRQAPHILTCCIGRPAVVPPRTSIKPRSRPGVLLAYFRSDRKRDNWLLRLANLRAARPSSRVADAGNPWELRQHG
ncbi:MAG: hypothetical protein Q7J32_18045, partial [Sphingomonadaceae bacterium]|nr:hypothetical protein [Sphingomonadaceae bacterium]